MEYSEKYHIRVPIISWTKFICDRCGCELLLADNDKKELPMKCLYCKSIMNETPRYCGLYRGSLR